VNLIEHVDIPSALLNYGDLNLFGANELNKPGATTVRFQPNKDDYADQTACGIPDNAFAPSNVYVKLYCAYESRELTDDRAIHPLLAKIRSSPPWSQS